MVTNSDKKWVQEVSVDKNIAEEMAKELGVSSLFIEVCFQRGLKTIDEIESFLTIDESWFHDPFLMHDMEKGIERIVQAIESGEGITIYGDYDADGITATTLLYETLDSIGANVNYYLPNRFIEGYGPNREAFDTIIQEGTTLIITVDNGVTGHEAINFANEQNVDVIVTDHHALPEVLPEAYAVIHPNHPDGEYPFGDLAGVGVALKVAAALIGELPVELLDLAAIGTVADLVSLTDENRAIVFFGLKMIENTQRTGLLQLLQIIETDSQEVDEGTIGFQIAPRLNAVGRLGDASPGVKMLATHDLYEAQELAEFIDSQNFERKEIVEEMTADVLEKLKQSDEQAEVVILADENWHQGVLGIVASRVVEEVNKPTLLFTIDSETNIAKGSARSIEGINLHEAFISIENLFIHFGGHDMAAGMAAKIEQLPIIEKKLSEYMQMHAPKITAQKVDAFLDLKELSVETVQELNKLQPFGNGNERPVIVCEDVIVVQNRKVGATGDHLKLVVEQNEKQLDIISFRNGNLSDYLFEQQQISVAGYVEVNEWNGLSKAQMQMIDLEIPGPILVDARINKLSAEHFEEENVDYIFYTTENYEKAIEVISKSSNAILLENAQEAAAFRSQKKMVIVDCPTSIELFNATLDENVDIPVDCYFYKEEHLYLTGVPTRAEFSKVYKFFAAQKAIDLQKNGHHMIAYLKMEANKVFLIVKVFLEAKFVIIENGLLKIVKDPNKINLEETASYQNAIKQFEAEELFIYSSFKEIIQSLK